MDHLALASSRHNRILFCSGSKYEDLQGTPIPPYIATNPSCSPALPSTATAYVSLTTTTETAYTPGPTITQFYPSPTTATVVQTLTEYGTLTWTLTSYVGAWKVVTSTAFLPTTATLTQTVVAVSTHTEYVGVGMVPSTSRPPVVSARDMTTETRVYTATATRESWFSFCNGVGMGVGVLTRGFTDEGVY